MSFAAFVWCPSVRPRPADFSAVTVAAKSGRGGSKRRRKASKGRPKNNPPPEPSPAPGNKDFAVPAEPLVLAPDEDARASASAGKKGPAKRKGRARNGPLPAVRVSGATMKPQEPESRMPGYEPVLELLRRGTWVGFGLLFAIFVYTHFVAVGDLVPKFGEN